MKIRRIKVIKPVIEEKTATQINFGRTRKFGISFITEIDIDLEKNKLKIKKFSKNYF